MPLIATKGAASAQGFGEFAQTTAPVYIEDVFSTYLYTGNGSTQTITNNIDLSTKGGLVWIKNRSLQDSGNTRAHWLFDSARTAGYSLSTNSTSAQSSVFGGLIPFSTTGFSINTGDANLNGTGSSAYTYVSWTFREQPKFFDIVTYTGNGVGGRTVSHNLGSTPGCILIKSTSATADWAVWHRGDGTTAVSSLSLNTPDSSTTSTVTVNSTEFSTAITNYIGAGQNVNGRSYVAYLFAHNAGGFGTSGSDNVISCGSVVGASQVEVNLGWEPQWILIKNASAYQDWWVVDNMRGLPVQDTSSAYNASNLRPNLSDAETTGFAIAPSATGFKANVLTAGQTYIYIAIRRGPMKTPTSGTSVFAPYVTSSISNVGSSSTPLYNFGFLTDTIIQRNKAGTDGWYMGSRLQGTNYLKTETTAAEASSPALVWDSNVAAIAFSSANYGTYGFKRAPGFFDVVCYTGTSSNTTISHNLGVAPELIICKSRSSNPGANWVVWNQTLNSSTGYLYLNATLEASNFAGVWNGAPTSTYFTLGTNYQNNNSGVTFVAYLFATVAGVSKVGSYTGTGALQTVNCGFTGGARFVLIKRTDSTGDWWVYDSARGISSGNDPYLFLNSSAAEVTNTNYVDTTSVGFQVTAAAPAGLNANGGTYIFLAIA